MSATAYRRIVNRLRSAGITVIETSGCYGRNNGLAYQNGQPTGHIEHHFVCSLNPKQGYIDGLVDMLVNGYSGLPGPIVPWFADVNGVAYLVATGPSNHAGKGNSSVLSNIRSDRVSNVPPGAGDMTGNGYLSGTEGQHPGDSTPWPEKLLETMAAISAAEAVEFGWSANRVIQHWQWTTRKSDMSDGGGPRNPQSAAAHRQRVQRWIEHFKGEALPKPAPQPAPEEEDDMAHKVLLVAPTSNGSGLVGIWDGGIRHVDSSDGKAYSVYESLGYKRINVTMAYWNSNRATPATPAAS